MSNFIGPYEQTDAAKAAHDARWERIMACVRLEQPDRMPVGHQRSSLANRPQASSLRRGTTLHSSGGPARDLPSEMLAEQKATGA